MTEAERIIDTPDDTAAGGPDEPRAERPEGAADAAPVSRGKRRIGVLAAVAVTAYVLDLATKIMTVEWLENRAPVPIFGEWLRFEAVRNSGAAFGMGQSLTILLTCIAAVVVIVILRLARKLYSAPWAIALGLLLGGALGNLTDRIFRAPGVFQGAVVDFIAPKHFAVFNLADSAIVCGGILIVLLSFRGLDPDGTRHGEELEGAGPDPEADRAEGAEPDPEAERAEGAGPDPEADRGERPDGAEAAEAPEAAQTAEAAETAATADVTEADRDRAETAETAADPEAADGPVGPAEDGSGKDAKDAKDSKG